MGKKSQIVVLVSFLLSACIERDAEKAAAEQLIDPDSAKFRNLRTIENAAGEFVCGEINGKNRMGAYNGFSRFIYVNSSRLAFLESDEPNPAGERKRSLDQMVDCLEDAHRQGESDLWDACSAETDAHNEARLEAEASERFELLWKNHCS